MFLVGRNILSLISNKCQLQLRVRNKTQGKNAKYILKFLFYSYDIVMYHV